MLEAKNCFNKAHYAWNDETSFDDLIEVKNLKELKDFLDIVHIRACLIKPYTEQPDTYPLVDIRMLLPSFESDPFEYQELPGFSMLVLDRQLHSFSELFQYDPLYPISDEIIMADGACCPLETQVFNLNTQSILSRLPKQLHNIFKHTCTYLDVTLLEHYPLLLPLLLEMDRAHIISKNNVDSYHLSGVFASFPSDLDGELKRYGLRIEKFQSGDSKLYLRNRLFTLQFLMELYGFPISSERRTSSALFARRLHKIGENFLVRVLGQSDRTLTTIWNDKFHTKYPRVEKVALIKVEDNDTIQELQKLNAFLDPVRKVAIARVTYMQHSYSPTNVRQDRALSVFSQTIIHPESGVDILHLNFLRDTSSLLLSLNDISNGEFHGKTVYKRTEVIEGTSTEEKRLKVFYSWLLKHQRRIISYGDESFSNFTKLFDNYFNSIEYIVPGHEEHALKSELKSRFYYIQQARKLRDLEEISNRVYKNKPISYFEMLSLSVAILNEYKFELFTYFDDLVSASIKLMELILNDRYLQRSYIEKDETKLTQKGLQIKKKYRALVQLHDTFKDIQKNHKAD